MYQEIDEGECNRKGVFLAQKILEEFNIQRK